MLSLDHMQDSMRPKLIGPLTIAEPFLTILGNTLNYAFRVMHSTIRTRVLGQGSEIVGFDSCQVRSFGVGHRHGVFVETLPRSVF